MIRSNHTIVKQYSYYGVVILFMTIECSGSVHSIVFYWVSKVFEGLPIYLRVCYEGQALKIA